MASQSTLKVAEQIKLITAEMLAHRINDPRLGFITITDVRLSKDWHEAKIFYTVLGDELARTQSAEALEAAKGQVRTAVARSLKMRFTPTIEFVLDELPVVSAQFDELLASVRQSDAQIASQAQGAQFAGDEDPYKRSDEEEDA